MMAPHSTRPVATRLLMADGRPGCLRHRVPTFWRRRSANAGLPYVRDRECVYRPLRARFEAWLRAAAAPFVAMPYVSSYSRSTPELGVPFFCWYQLL
jgi:hypothetical protein